MPFRQLSLRVPCRYYSILAGQNPAADL